jgi:carbonic anhydrase
MTSLIKPLPQDLIDRYKNWKSDSFANDRSLYENLALEGQSPIAMIISCL